MVNVSVACNKKTSNVWKLLRRKLTWLCCQFRVLSVGKELVALQGDNGLFTSHVHDNGIDSIEAVKGGIDEECKRNPRFWTSA